MIHQVLERIGFSTTTFLFFAICILMPKRKCCEHPIKHANSARIPNGSMAVSLDLSKFLISRYNMIESRVRWLCPRCHAFEFKEMMFYQPSEMSDNEISTDDDNDVVMVETPENCVTNDDDQEFKELNDGDDEDEEEDNSLMDSGFMNQSKENDDDSLDMDEKSTDRESMDEEEEDVILYEQEYRRNKAVEQLSAVFELLQIEPIHDKYVRTVMRIF